MDSTVETETSSYNDEDPTCERAVAKLLIYPGEISPHQVSEILGVAPTRMVNKGAVSKNPLNVWILSSESLVQSLDIRRHLDWLLPQIDPKRMAQIQNLPEQKSRITCVWWSKHGGGAPSLLPRHLRMLADLNITVYFDLSFYGEEE